jgi:hypothetical protein
MSGRAARAPPRTPIRAWHEQASALRASLIRRGNSTGNASATTKRPASPGSPAREGPGSRGSGGTAVFVVFVARVVLVVVAAVLT